MLHHFCLNNVLGSFAFSSEVVNVGGSIKVFGDCVDVGCSIG